MSSDSLEAEFYRRDALGVLLFKIKKVGWPIALVTAPTGLATFAALPESIYAQEFALGGVLGVLVMSLVSALSELNVRTQARVEEGLNNSLNLK